MEKERIETILNNASEELLERFYETLLNEIYCDENPAPGAQPPFGPRVAAAACAPNPAGVGSEEPAGGRGAGARPSPPLGGCLR